MKVAESFSIPESPAKVWTFFEDVEQVARCVPGVEQVEQVGDDDFTAVVTQAVGPMTATFDLKLKITERREQELLQFTAVGRSVRGAGGNVRATNTVRLSPGEDGATTVDVEADLAMGGVLGSLGQKVVAKQVASVTRQFSTALQEAISGGGAPSAAGAAAVGGRRKAVSGTGGSASPSSSPAVAAAAGGTDRRAPILALSIVSVVLSFVVAVLAGALVRQTDDRS